MRGIQRAWIAFAICSGAFLQAPRMALARDPQGNGTTTRRHLETGEQSARATRGIVKAIDSTTMTISRPKNRGEITFKLGPEIHREGTIVIGATVAVRYRDEGGQHIATAVTVQRPSGR